MELFNFIDKAAAECLLAGMMTDTGNFAYNCNDPELYIVVAELIRKGADKEKLNNMLFNTFSFNCLRLNAYAILKNRDAAGRRRCPHHPQPRRTQPLPLHARRHRRPRKPPPRRAVGAIQRVHAPGERLHTHIHAEARAHSPSTSSAPNISAAADTSTQPADNTTALSTRPSTSSTAYSPDIEKEYPLDDQHNRQQ